MNRIVQLAMISFVGIMLSLGTDIASQSKQNVSGRVRLLRVPNKGLQPQSVMDDRGALHLIYFLGESGGGDIYYVRRDPGRPDFTTPLRVNSESGSAVAIGTIRGAQLAIGKSGRIYVAWNGPQNPESHEAPMLFTRMNDARSGFEAQRKVMQFSGGLDGGGSVAADQSGNVIVVWHGRGDQEGEEFRRVWIARSTDEGRTIAREVPAWDEPTGACGCCGMKAFSDRTGRFHLLYRAATGGVDRDMYLLTSSDHGRTFSGALIDKWKLDTCPMSSAALTDSTKESNGLLAAWETQGQVLFTNVNSNAAQTVSTVPAPGATDRRKHPAIAVNLHGEILFLWTEGTGWKKGGSLAWQIYDSQGNPTRDKGEAPGIPIWSFASVIAEKDGHFTIIY